MLVNLDGLTAPLAMTGVDGRWSATSARLRSGTYCYSYSVDGRNELDPANAEVMPNYAYLCSVVRIKDAEGAAWEQSDVPHGVVHRHFYKSSLIQGLPGGGSEYFVYTPAGYDRAVSTRYPVLYLLHGLSQGAADWTAMGGANFVLDTLIAEGKAKPMVVVMPLGYGDMAVAGKQPQERDFGPLLIANNAVFTRILSAEIMPRVEADYRVETSPKRRAIAGLSMGGAQSLEIGLNGAGEFAWIGGLSAADAFVRRPVANCEEGSVKLLWMACGTSDWLIDSNRKFVCELQQQGYAVKLEETPGAHIWPVWQRNLVRFAQLLF